MSGNGPNGGTATAQAHPTLRTGTRWGSWLEKVTKKPSFGAARVTSAWAAHCFPDLPPFAAASFNAYGIATVRLYVGAVKRVALPIVSQAINGPDACISTALENQVLGLRPHISGLGLRPQVLGSGSLVLGLELHPPVPKFPPSETHPF